MSVPQTPQAATLIRISLGPTSGTGTSSTRTTPLSRYTPARMVFGTVQRVPADSVSDGVAVIARRPLHLFPRPKEESDVESLLHICQESPQDFVQLSRFSFQTRSSPTAF